MVEETLPNRTITHEVDGERLNTDEHARAFTTATTTTSATTTTTTATATARTTIARARHK